MSLSLRFQVQGHPMSCFLGCGRGGVLVNKEDALSISARELAEPERKLPTFGVRYITALGTEETQTFVM